MYSVRNSMNVRNTAFIYEAMGFSIHKKECSVLGYS